MLPIVRQVVHDGAVYVKFSNGGEFSISAAEVIAAVQAASGSPAQRREAVRLRIYSELVVALGGDFDLSLLKVSFGTSGILSFEIGR